MEILPDHVLIHNSSKLARCVFVCVCVCVCVCISIYLQIQFSSVQFSSVAQSCLTLCDPVNHSTPGLPVHHQLPEFTQTHIHRVSDAIQPSHPRLPSSLALNLFPVSGSFPMSWLFTSGGQILELQHKSSNEYSGLISFRIECFDLLAVQGTLKSLLQHRNSKPQFFSTQPSLWSNSHIPT